LRLVGLGLGVMLILWCEFLFLFLFVRRIVLSYLCACLSPISRLSLDFVSSNLFATILTTTIHHHSNKSQKTRSIRRRRRRSSTIREIHSPRTDAQAYLRLHHRTYRTTIIHHPSSSSATVDSTCILISW